MGIRSRLLSSLLFVLVVLLAGCGSLGAGPTDSPTPTPAPTGTPTPTPTAAPTATPTPTPTANPDLRDLSVVLRGNESTPFTVTLLLVDDPIEQVTVRYANGTERTFDASARGDLPAGALVDAVRLSPDVPVEREAVFENRSADTSVEGVPTAASDVFYFVTVDGRVHDWDAVTCGDGDVTRLDLFVHGAGVSTEAVECAL